MSYQKSLQTSFPSLISLFDESFLFSTDTLSSTYAPSGCCGHSPLNKVIFFFLFPLLFSINFRFIFFKTHPLIFCFFLWEPLFPPPLLTIHTPFPRQKTYRVLLAFHHVKLQVSNSKLKRLVFFPLSLPGPRVCLYGSPRWLFDP